VAINRLATNASFEDAMRAAYKAALCSPNFLFLQEAPGPLDDFALASRLSYFLWNSMPDDALFDLAAKKQLHDLKVLREQTERMLKDLKAARFAVDFLDQWLDLRDIDSTSPDRRLYPEFSGFLRDSMLAESRAFFYELLKNDLGIAMVVQSDFAMLNQPLAELYGIPDVAGVAVRSVLLPAGSHRGGLLTQAAVLKVTANGTTTSPVKRGAWVQRKIVGQPPDPPPPDVPAVEPDVRGAVTIREQLAKHRSNAACAVCHAKMDPAGFALESYDVIGGFRERYRSLEKGTPVDRKVMMNYPAYAHIPFKQGLAVDPAGRTSRDQAFRNVEDFRAILLADERQLARNFVGQLLVYATGSPVGYADRAAVEKALNAAAPGRYGLRTLVHEVVQSEMFRTK
jgi:hypothetical protein